MLQTDWWSGIELAPGSFFMSRYDLGVVNIQTASAGLSERCQVDGEIKYGLYFLNS